MMANISILCHLLVLLLLASQLAAAAPNPRILSTLSPSIFVFGSSMVDTGQNSAAMPRRSHADFTPYGSDYFGKPSGRWSNGHTLLDFITEALSYGNLSPYLQSIRSNFSHGVNFASGGSTASNSTVTANDDSAGLFCLLVQVDQFRDFQAAVTSSQHGLQAKENMRRQFSDSFYFVETGHNDYIAAVYEGGGFDVFDLNMTVLAAIAAMRTAFQVLYGVGARTFIVMNASPVGCSPYMLTVPGTGVSEDLDENNCNAFWMDVVGAHNAQLSRLLEELRTDYPTAEWVLFDAYSLFLDGYTNPSKYGIKYPFEACCGAGGPHNVHPNVSCGAKAQTINGTYVAWKKCEDPRLHLIWDTIHPVESFAYYAAQGVLNGTSLFPSISILERVQSLKRGERAQA